MDTNNTNTHAVIYWNYKVRDWRMRKFSTLEAATEFYNVRMERALRNAPKLSNGWVSDVQTLTPKMRTL